MALTTLDKDILEEIVTVDGHCMNPKRCEKCPFRAICLPEFLNPIPPSQEQRFKMAQDILTHHYLIDDEIDIKEHVWDKR